MADEGAFDPNSIKKSVNVQATPDIAWRVFTEKMRTWWPLAYYKIGKANAVDAVIEPLHQVRIVRRIGLERGAVVEGAVDLRPLDHDVANVVLVDLGQELREGDVLRGRALTRILEKREERQQQ